MRYSAVILDPPWTFSDKLEMSNVKRGAASQYKVLDNQEIVNLDIKSIAEDNAILALWVPSTLLPIGLEAMENYGFDFKQTWIWVKTKKDPLESLKKDLKKAIKAGTDISATVDAFNLDNVLAFYMGHLFRQTHEICLIGTRGKVSKLLKNKSQRSVSFKDVGKHSAKPEILQDRLDIMFPDVQNKLEVFARRARTGWETIGNQSPTNTIPNEDIRDAIERLKNK
jgi:N6-adenosine-specific RNA methylase IME4